jgi:uncharacterized spore protein YtfJ
MSVGSVQSLGDTLNQVKDLLSVKRVFGEPYEKNGVTILPAARLRGGWGGGTSGEGGPAEARGWGGGFGTVAVPAGVYVIQGNSVDWRPAVDVNRIVLGGQIVMIILALALLRSKRARR